MRALHPRRITSSPARHPQDMKLPKPLLDYLKNKKILSPTPIQLQGIPVAYDPFLHLSPFPADLAAAPDSPGAT